MICFVGVGMARGSRLRISAPSEITVTSPRPQYPSFPRACRLPIPDLGLIGVAGDEIATTRIAAPTAPTSGDDDLKVPSHGRIGTANVRRVDTDDKLLE
ncbi:hypothetical protein [Phyllobacterium sp.]|uniref:hypothetical protein n=1 Tax=Phyllobacterium sp. TaxID=1871046 RepID=UPI0030F41EA9